MLDIKWIRQNPEGLDQALARRGHEAASQTVLSMDAALRSVLTELQDLQNIRNDLAKQIGQAKRNRDAAEDLVTQGNIIKEKVGALEDKERHLTLEMHKYVSALPNILAEEVPEGLREEDAKLVRTVGEPKSFSFEPKRHFELGEALGQMDFERASKIAGSRFVVLMGPLARLERALAAFMLDVHTKEFGYTEVLPPSLVRTNAVYGVGQLPKFSEDLFQTTDDRWLISTAEVPLTNLVSAEILSESELPLRFTAYTHCYRSEAGSAGKDTRGMIRNHEFTKVELVSITTPDQAEAEHERLTSAAEEILKRLDLAYRVVMLSAGDTGASSRKTYDLEVWLPGEGAYREISSCSQFGDYQARRMNTRYRPEGGDKQKPVFVHTLNGSGLAVGRTLIAIVENYQQVDGSIKVPDVLVPYMDGLEEIK